MTDDDLERLRERFTGQPRPALTQGVPGDPCIFPSTSSFSEADAPVASVKEGGE